MTSKINIKLSSEELREWGTHNINVLLNNKGQYLGYFKNNQGLGFLKALSSWEVFLYCLSKWLRALSSYLGYYYDDVEVNVKEIISNLVPRVSINTFDKFSEKDKKLVITTLFFKSLALLPQKLFNRSLIHNTVKGFLFDQIQLDPNNRENDVSDTRPQWFKQKEFFLYQKARFAQLMYLLRNYKTGSSGCADSIRIQDYDGKIIGIFKRKKGSSLVYSPNLLRWMVNNVFENSSRKKDFGETEFYAEQAAFEITELLNKDEAANHAIFTPTVIVAFQNKFGTPGEIGSFGEWFENSNVATNYFGLDKKTYQKVKPGEAFPSEFFEEVAFHFFLRGDQDSHAENILAVYDSNNKLTACVPIDAGQSFPGHFPERFPHLGKPFLIGKHENAKNPFSKNIGKKILKAIQKWKEIEKILLYTYERRLFYDEGVQFLGSTPISQPIERVHRVLERLAVMFILHEKGEPIANLNNYRRKQDIQNYFRQNIDILIKVQDEKGNFIFPLEFLQILSISLEIDELNNSNVTRIRSPKPFISTLFATGSREVSLDSYSTSSSSSKAVS